MSEIGSSTAAVADLAEAYWTLECEEAPLTAILAGQPVESAVVFKESPADHNRRAARARALLERVLCIDAVALDATSGATLSLLKRELDSICTLHALDAHLRPSLLPAGPDFNTVFLSNVASIGDVASAKLHADRLETFPAFLDDVRACLLAGHAKGIRYPRTVLSAAAANTRGLASSAPDASAWYSPFRRSPVADDPPVKADAERALAFIEARLIPAFYAFADFLAGPLSEGAREGISCTDAPQGQAFYKAQVERFTSLKLSPDEVHAIGLSEVDRIQAEMEEVAAQAGYANDLKGYQRFLSAAPQFVAPDAETLRQQMEVVCKRIDAKIPSYFTRLPRITYGVDTIPAASSKMLPPAYAQPSPGDGSTAGVLWVSGLPEKCPAYLHPALAVHEGWPGHLMHIALMQELSELPKFRRYGAVKYTACIEGWALYCEYLGLDMGVYQTPHQNYGRLELEMWRAVRLVVDTGIHWRGWTRQGAIDYMADRLTLSQETIEAEVDRYAALPGQALAYQIGGLKVRELRQRARDALGPRFTYRAFHEAVMTAGPVTLDVLDKIVTDWIARHELAPSEAA